jgi:hypothetical protein
VGTGTGGTADAAVAAAVTTAVAVATCRDPVATDVPRGGSLVAAALHAAHGALDERLLMGTNASDLSTLAGARAGTFGTTLRTKKHKTELQPLEIRGAWESATYLKLEKPRFLFLEGSEGAATTPVITAAALGDSPVALAGASAARATSSTDHPAAAPAPLQPLRPLVTGVGDNYQDRIGSS